MSWLAACGFVLLFVVVVMVILFAGLLLHEVHELLSALWAVLWVVALLGTILWLLSNAPAAA